LIDFFYFFFLSKIQGKKQEKYIKEKPRKWMGQPNKYTKRLAQPILILAHPKKKKKKKKKNGRCK
jgi:hypothetical protein